MSRDELIRRAMLHATPRVARPGMAVGGKPGESAMAQAEANRNFSAGANRTGPASDNGFRSSPIGGGNAGANRLGAGSQISNTLSRTERTNILDNPEGAAARLGPNAAMAMRDAGVSPDTAIRGAMSLNRSGAPANERMAPLNVGPKIDPAGAVLGYDTDIRMPDMGSMLGPMPTMTSYANEPLDNALSMSNSLAGANDVMQYGSPIASGVVKDLPGALRSSGTRLHAGVDFAAPTGTQVTPSMPGTVVQVTNASGYGPMVDVQDIYGNIQRYAVHDTGTIGVQPGQYVAPGDVIGTVGAQNVPKAFEHLHFEHLTPGDRAYNEIMGKYEAGNFGGFAGSTKSPRAAGTVNSSTGDWLKSLGIGTGDVMSTRVGTPSQLAANAYSGPTIMDRFAGGVQNVTPAAAPAPAPAQVAAARMGTPSVYEAAANPIANAYSAQAQADAIAAAQKAGITGYSYNKAIPGEYAVTSTTQSPSQFAALAQSVEQRLAAFSSMTEAQKKAWAADPKNAAAIAKLSADIQTLQKMPIDKYGLKKEGTYSIVGNVPSGFTQIGEQAYSVPYGKTYANNVTFSAPQGIPQTVNKIVNTPMARAIAPGYGADASPVVASAGPQNITNLGYQNDDFRGVPAQVTPASTGVVPTQTAYGMDDFRAPPSSRQVTATPSVSDTVPNQVSVTPTADMPAPMNYVPMVPRTPIAPPPDANIFQLIANAMLPENLFPNALYTQPTPPGQYLVQSPDNMGPLSGYMMEPFRIDRNIGVAKNPITGIEDPNANVITTASGRQMAFNPFSGRYEYVSKFRGSLDERPGGDNREQNREYTQGRQNRTLLSLGYTQAEIDAMSPEKIKEIIEKGIRKAASGGRIGYKKGGSSKKSSAPVVDSYYGPAQLPDLPAFNSYGNPPTYNFPTPSPMISGFVGALPQPSSMPAMLPPVNLMTQPRPQYSQKDQYFNPFENLFGYNQSLSNMGQPMNSGGSVNTSNDSISNAMRLIRR